MAPTSWKKPPSIHSDSRLQQLHLGVSENRRFSPQIIHFFRVFLYKPSILGVFRLFLETPTFYWFFQLDDDSQLMKHEKAYVCESPFPSILKHGCQGVPGIHLNLHLTSPSTQGSQGLDEFGIDDTGPNADAIDSLRTQFHLEPLPKKKGTQKRLSGWWLNQPFEKY